MPRKTRILTLLAVAAALLLSWATRDAAAEDLDPASAEALRKTQQLLRDSEARKGAAAATQQGESIHREVEKLAGSERNTQMIYELAADVLGDLAKEAGGDPAKMVLMLEKAKKNPEAFGKRLSPEQVRRLQEISDRLPTGGAKAP